MYNRRKHWSVFVHDLFTNISELWQITNEIHYKFLESMHAYYLESRYGMAPGTKKDTGSAIRPFFSCQFQFWDVIHSQEGEGEAQELP